MTDTTPTAIGADALIDELDAAGTATVEDGSIAKLALSGHVVRFEDEDAIAPSEQAPAQAAPAAVAGPSDAELFALMEKHLGLSPRRDDTVIDRLTGRFHDAQRYREFAREVLAAAAPQPPVAAPVAQGDALPREDFAWLVVQEACETEPADEDDPECIRILRRDLKSAVLAAFLRHDAARARAQAKEGEIHE